jgi:16S rRNA G1207 methylase RsmC
MARRKPMATYLELIEDQRGRIRAPVGVILGSPREVAELVAALPGLEVICYQMDLYQAERLTEALRERETTGQVITAADLWDLSAGFHTLLYPVPRGGERGLKLDMIEQAFHALRPGGQLIVLSPYEKDQLFPLALKKVFGRAHAPAAGDGMVLWSQREGDRPRRRHEVTFQVSGLAGRPLRFLSRPGTFSYGRFDNGARALVEIMQIDEGDRVLDIGCGVGTNGIHAALRSGPDGSTTFVDSNVRAVALAEHNARENGVVNFRAVASSKVDVPDGDFDVALANPPYYAQHDIARLFIDRARHLLKPDGRLYLVTKQPNQVGPMVAEVFQSPAEVVERRGYVVLCASRLRV